VGLMLFNGFINDLSNDRKHTISKFVGDVRLWKSSQSSDGKHGCNSEASLQPGEMGQQVSLEVQQRQMQSPAPERNNPRLNTGWGLESNSAGKDLGLLVDNKITKSAVCPCSREGQQRLGLH